MADASWLVQKAIFNVLDAGLSIPVYDSVPVNPAFPYCTVGDDVTADASSKTDSGQELVATIHVWSRERGRWQVKQTIDQIDDLLHDETLAIEQIGSPPTAPYAVAYVRRDVSQTFADPDGLTMHGVASFRLRVTAP